jgi:hypothetical protein
MQFVDPGTCGGGNGTNTAAPARADYGNIDVWFGHACTSPKG